MGSILPEGWWRRGEFRLTPELAEVESQPVLHIARRLEAVRGEGLDPLLRSAPPERRNASFPACS
jgi:hypothetical protein